MAAQCILPVSMNSRLSNSLGTRHRAAIGLTEETDASVLVVSEERKEISLSYRGQLIRGANEDIRKSLLDVISGNIPKKFQGKDIKVAVKKNKIDPKKKTKKLSKHTAIKSN